MHNKINVIQRVKIVNVKLWNVRQEKEISTIGKTMKWYLGKTGRGSEWGTIVKVYSPRRRSWCCMSMYFLKVPKICLKKLFIIAMKQGLLGWTESMNHTAIQEFRTYNFQGFCASHHIHISHTQPSDRCAMSLFFTNEETNRQWCWVGCSDSRR